MPLLDRLVPGPGPPQEVGQGVGEDPSDLRLATAYVMPLGGRDEEPVVAALNRNRKALRAEVAQRVNLKFAPDLRFLRDETFDEAARIDALLRSDKVQRDVSKPKDDES